MYYYTTVLDKYNFAYIKFDTNAIITRQSVPEAYRLPNTVIAYLDFSGFLHIELFSGTCTEIDDNNWGSDSNWISTKLIYHKCFNQKWDNEFATTAYHIPCALRYRGNILHIQDVPYINKCGETSYESKTYRYKCTNFEDYEYGDFSNWEEFDFQSIVEDVMNIVTELLAAANDIDYGLITPDEEMIENLVEDLFLKWLTDEKLEEIVNECFNNYDFEGIIKTTVSNFLEEYDIQSIVNEYFNSQEGDTILSEAIENSQTIIALQTTIKDLQSSITKLENDITSLQTAYNDLEPRVVALETALTLKQS